MRQRDKWRIVGTDFITLISEHKVSSDADGEETAKMTINWLQRRAAIIKHEICVIVTTAFVV